MFDLQEASTSTSVYLPYDLSTSRCRSISLCSERTNFPWLIPLSSFLPIEITPLSSRTRAHPFQVSPHSLRSCSCALRRKTGPSAGFFLGGAQLGFPRPSVVGRPAEGAGEADDGDGDAAGAVFGVCSRVSLRMPAGPPAQSLRFRLKGAMGEWEGESPLRIGNVGMRYGGKCSEERREDGPT